MARCKERSEFVDKLTNMMMQLGLIPEFRLDSEYIEEDFKFGDGQCRLTIFNLGKFDSEDWEHQEFILFMISQGWERLKSGNVFTQIKNNSV